MNKNTPFDFVWLGLLVGQYESMSANDLLRDQLLDMGLTRTRDRLPEGDMYYSANLESLDISNWIAEELEDKGFSATYAGGVDVYNSNDLINSLRPGVWAYVPQSAQREIIGAETSIRSGNLSGAAKQLVCGVETMMKHFYHSLIPTGGKKSSWSDMEKDLFTRAVAVQAARRVDQTY